MSTEIRSYVKRPVTVLAGRFILKAEVTCGPEVGFGPFEAVHYGCTCELKGQGCSYCDKFWVKTAGHGKVIVQNGDYIIKGIKGEFYPCHADVFADSYDPA